MTATMAMASRLVDRCEVAAVVRMASSSRSTAMLATLTVARTARFSTPTTATAAGSGSTCTSWRTMATAAASTATAKNSSTTSTASLAVGIHLLSPRPPLSPTPSWDCEQMHQWLQLYNLRYPQRRRDHEPAVSMISRRTPSSSSFNSSSSIKCHPINSSGTQQATTLLSSTTAMAAGARSPAATPSSSLSRPGSSTRSRAETTSSPTPAPPPPPSALPQSGGRGYFHAGRWASSMVMPSNSDFGSSSASEQALQLSDSAKDLLRETGIQYHDLVILAQQRPTPLSLAEMYQYGRTSHADLRQRLRNGQFLHRELPIRIAHRAVDLLTLPHGLSDVDAIKQVAAVYLKYLHQFQLVPAPTTAEQDVIFTNMLQSLVLDRTKIPTSIAAGVMAWREQQRQQQQHYQHPLDCHRVQEMEDALYRFFTARVGLRFLTEHYVLSCARPSSQALRQVTHLCYSSRNDSSTQHQQQQQAHGVDFVELGCIQTNCDIALEVRRVADLVLQQTKSYYRDELFHAFCPEIEIVDCNAEMSEFTYVPHHLQYMLTELLKNSVRATIQWQLQREMARAAITAAAAAENDGDGKPSIAAGGSTVMIGNSSDMDTGDGGGGGPPSIRVIIAKGEEDVTIKIADKGGGIPRSVMDEIWRFSHSTSSEEEARSEFGTDAVSGGHLRGFGLPLARIYARYFGGELTLKSTEGYGLDAYLHLPRLGDACENLPMRVRDSPGERDSLPDLIRTTGSGGSASAVGRHDHHHHHATTLTTTTTTSLSSDYYHPTSPAPSPSLTNRRQYYSSTAS